MRLTSLLNSHDIYVEFLLCTGKNCTYLVKMHKMIRIIVEDQKVVFTGYFVNFFSSFQRHNDASRICTRRVYIHYFWHFCTGNLTILQSFSEHFRYGTIVVLWDYYKFRFVRRYL